MTVGVGFLPKKKI